MTHSAPVWLTGRREGLSGTDAIPNAQFWRELPTLVAGKKLVNFLCCLFFFATTPVWARCCYRASVSVRVRTCVPLSVCTGGLEPSMAPPFASFVETPTFAGVLAGMVHDHAAGRHVCVIGERGSGKSALAQAFATRLGYRTEVFSPVSYTHLTLPTIYSV